MSTEANKILLEQVIVEASHKRNLEMVDRFMAVVIADHDPFASRRPGVRGKTRSLSSF